jgi:hypothetical protein
VDSDVDETRVTDVRTPGSAASDLTPSATDRLQLDRIGRFLVLRKLSEGGMGVVYIAYDPDLDRQVAIKLLRPRDGGEAQEHARQRLLREAQALARLSHPNVVQIHEVGTTPNGRVFLAMELISGLTVREWATRAPRRWPQVVAVFVEAGRGLAAAHAAGLVHRDIKPDNLLVGDDGRTRVLDFGLSRPPAVASAAPIPADLSGSVSSPISWHVTAAGSLVGTPAYMSPEQFLRVEADARSDQFSFCVALWEALFGVRPFAGREVGELSQAVVRGELRPPPPGRRVPAWLQRALVRGLQRDPDDRFPGMDALLAELTRDHGRVRRALVGAAVLAAAAAVVLGLRAGEADGARCTGAAAEVAAVWDEPQRAALRAAFAATGLAYAAGAADAAVARLDGYAGEWAAQSTAACEATVVRREASPQLLDRKNACLQRRLDGLGALAAVLGRADATAVERAPEAIAALAPLAPCASEAYLLAEVEPPADPAEAIAVHELRRRLAAVEAELRAGAYARARAAADAAHAAALRLSYPPARAEALLFLGRARNVDDRDHPPVELVDAFHAALQARDEEVARRAAVELSDLHLFHWRWSEAEIWLRLAEDLAARNPEAARDDAVRLAAMRSNLEVGQGELAAADADSLRAIALAEANGAPRVLASALSSRSVVLLRLSRALEARTTMERLYSVQTTLYPPGHPRLRSSRLNLALAMRQAGEYEAALAEMLTHGPLDEPGLDDSVRGTRMQNLSGVYAGLGRFAEGLALAEQALAIYERIYGEHPSTGHMRLNVGMFRVGLGEPERGLESMRRGDELLARVLGPDHPDLLFSTAEIGWVLLVLGRVDEARPYVERAVRLAPRGPEMQDRVEALRGFFALADGRADEAVRRLSAAVAAYAAREPRRPHLTELGESRFRLAQARAAAGDAAGALADARVALEELTADGPRSDLPRRELEAWLAARTAPE